MAAITVTIPADAVCEGTYGEGIVAVEPGGVGFIPLGERHGRPRQLFWTWASPNLAFATIFVGVLAVAAFGLGFTWRGCGPDSGPRTCGRWRGPVRLR